MKRVSVSVARKIRVVSNGAVKGDKWARIVDAQTGKVLHVGQTGYIRKIAVGRYNALPNL